MMQIRSSYSSVNNLTSHVISEVPLAIALYSTSEELLDTLACFLDFQEIAELPRRSK